MLHTYLHVLFPSEPNVSRCRFFDLHFLDASLVVHDGLNVQLVKHIRHQLVTGRVSHHRRHGQRSVLSSVEVLHINANKDIISEMLYQCQIMRNVVPEALLIARSAPAASCLEITCTPDRVHRWQRCSGPTTTPAEAGRQSPCSQGSAAYRATPGYHWVCICEHLEQ